MSKKIVIGNWKMNPISQKEAENLFNKISKNLKVRKTEVIVCPPAIYLEKLKRISRKIPLGVQNVFYGDTGAETGEISAEMFYNLGVRYAIIGHSERRARGEGNEEINRKIKTSLSAGVCPIICIGEKERDESHEYLNFIKNQLSENLAGISKNSIAKLVVAYEPIWAIGKEALRGATGEEFREMKVFIRKILSDKFGAEAVESIRIIYGGSVNPKNALEFLKDGDTDGFLVGRDSLDPKKFIEIINITEHENN